MNIFINDYFLYYLINFLYDLQENWGNVQYYAYWRLKESVIAFEVMQKNYGRRRCWVVVGVCVRVCVWLRRLLGDGVSV